MQIQDSGRRPTAVDARNESSGSFRTFAKPSLEVDLDVFAQVFEAISATPSPQRDSIATDVTPVEKSAAGGEELSELKQVEDEESEEISGKSESTELSPTPYPALPVALESEAAPESIDSDSATESLALPADSNAETTDQYATTPGDSVPTITENNAGNVDKAQAPAEILESKSIVNQAETDEVTNASKNLETVDAEQADAALIDVETNNGRSDSKLGQKPAVDAATAASGLPNELDAEDTSRSANDSSNANQVDAETEKIVSAASDTFSDLRRDPRNQRDRSDSNFNESRQDAVNAPKDRDANSAEQKVTSSSEIQPASASNGPVENAASSTTSPIATATQAGATTPTPASAGIVAVSGQPAPTTGGATGTTDSLSISTASGARDSISEAPAATSAGKSRQADVADRARLVHRIAKAFQKMGADGGHVRLKMHPDELGGVQLEMQVKGRTVTATVTADNEQARQVIQASINDLRQRLESQGLVIERLDIQTRTDNGGAESWNQNPQQSGAGSRDESRTRDGAWRRQDEIRSGRISNKTAEFRAESTRMKTVAERMSGTSWLSDRGLDVKL